MFGPPTATCLYNTDPPNPQGGRRAIASHLIKKLQTSTHLQQGTKGLNWEDCNWNSWMFQYLISISKYIYIYIYIYVFMIIKVALGDLKCLGPTTHRILCLPKNDQKSAAWSRMYLHSGPKKEPPTIGLNYFIVHWPENDLKIADIARPAMGMIPDTKHPSNDEKQWGHYNTSRNPPTPA